MSLDVWLTTKGEPVQRKGTGVFIRDNGKQRELTPEEVAEKWPNAEVPEQEYETNEVFEYNITHNLTSMANAADLYNALWRPDEQGSVYAKDIVGQLERGLKRLQKDPDGFKKMNPDNGWGSYEGLVTFVELYLKACKEYPDAEIGVSR